MALADRWSDLHQQISTVSQSDKIPTSLAHQAYRCSTNILIQGRAIQSVEEASIDAQGDMLRQLKALFVGEQSVVRSRSMLTEERRTSTD